MEQSPPSNDLFFSEISFSSMKLTSMTISSLHKQLFTIATEVQSKCIPVAIKGKNIMCTAKTGSGKTLAFLIPSLEMLIHTQFSQHQGVGVLIITPTRELALQTYGVASKLLYPCKKTTIFLL